MLHGQLHVMFGGYWGYNVTKYEGIANLWAGSNVLLCAKFLWRQGFVRCPETCSDDTPASECKCSCPAEIRNGMSAPEILDKTGIYRVLGSMTANNMEEDVLAQYVPETARRRFSPASAPIVPRNGLQRLLPGPGHR